MDSVKSHLTEAIGSATEPKSGMVVIDIGERKNLGGLQHLKKTCNEPSPTVKASAQSGAINK